MKEKIHYYPRIPFWALWQKRQVEYKIFFSDDATTRHCYDEAGWLDHITIERKNGELEHNYYYPNGKIRERTTENKRGYSCFTWEANGQPCGGEEYNRDTKTRIIFYPNGKIKIRHNKSTGAYEEFFSNGRLKRKGVWLNLDGTIADDIRNCCSSFVTGNMQVKRQDEKRQEYNEAIDAINGLPPTAGRKIAKEALLKAFKESCKSR